ncbi:beta-glucosidase BglX [Neptunicella marina]|uniref:beta-glucosidase n=1 Tax=Neptunicella marina TaxID=2125989 RepID=A0A8J6IYW2_9ALTE|nr:beta-glucosidase BglX [Neptunicella marina]MBC3767700.1 beta-glucosidase BglX [Neptunicella marina]
MKGLSPVVCSVFMLLLSVNSQPIFAQEQAATTIEQKVELLLAKMTLQEKIGQTNLRGRSSRAKGPLPDNLKATVRDGNVGAFLNVMKPEERDELQRIAVEESRLGIPLLFGRDVIHGFKTIFPIPLGLAASWDPEQAKTAARVSAVEASEYGVNWTFAPMMDIARDPRWGRIAESFGEDTLMAERFAVAMVKGFQTDDLSAPTAMAATAKHLVGYGAAEGGRDYNTTLIPQNELRDVYLPPFKAAADAGVASMMTSFNDINGVPATGNRFILKDILRDEWHYTGMVVSDWNSVTEMIAHGYAADKKQAAQRAANAGLDMEMTSDAYEQHLAELIEQGQVDQQQLDDMVRHILTMKFRLNLFEHPGRYQNIRSSILSAEHKQQARQAAIDSAILLKNQQALPFDTNTSIALIGPLADAGHEQMGTWVFDGRGENSITVKQAMQATLGADKVHFASGLTYSRMKTTEGFTAAINAAKQADKIVFVGGEESILSGEAHSRASLRLPGAQEQLITELAKLDKPLILVVMAGRPINLLPIIDKVDAVLFNFHPGTMGGPAITDLLTGVVSPSGRLPVTWPKAGAQAPIYYNHRNTGRPASDENFVAIDDIPVQAWQSSLGNNSHYLDLGFRPAFPFGYGLTYSRFSYSNIQLSSPTMTRDGSIAVSADIQNIGSRQAAEVVQLYVRDKVADVVRPIRELKDWQKITLKPGESQRVSFTLTPAQLAFYNQQMQQVTEAGEFDVWIAPDAAGGLHASFSLTEQH